MASTQRGVCDCCALGGESNRSAQRPGRRLDGRYGWRRHGFAGDDAIAIDILIAVTGAGGVNAAVVWRGRSGAGRSDCGTECGFDGRGGPRSAAVEFFRRLMGGCA